jgi:hypothetical protein
VIGAGLPRTAHHLSISRTVTLAPCPASVVARTSAVVDLRDRPSGGDRAN